MECAPCADAGAARTRAEGRSAIPTGRAPIARILTHMDAHETADAHDEEHR